MSIQGSELQVPIDSAVAKAHAASTPQEAEQAFVDLCEVLATAEHIFGKDNKDVQSYRKVQAEILNHMSSSTASASAAAPTYRLAHSAPVGISNASANCAFISAMQLIMGAPRLAQKITEKDQRLAHLLTQVSTAQNTVGPGIATQLRKEVTRLLQKDGTGRGSVYDEWIRARLDQISRQPDILPVLHALLDAGDYSHSFNEKCNGDLLLDTETRLPREHKEPSIALDLSSSANRDIETLLECNLTNVTEDGNILSKQFKKTPDDLLLSALRFTFTSSGSRKINDDLEVPLEFRLNREHFTDGQAADYRLTSCIIHRGTERGGHYTTVRRVGDKWYVADDVTVREIDDPTRFIRQGYVFHYEKVEAGAGASFSPVRPAPAIDLSGPERPAPARTCGELALKAIWCLGWVTAMAYRGIQRNIEHITNAKKDS